MVIDSCFSGGITRSPNLYLTAKTFFVTSTPARGISNDSYFEKGLNSKNIVSLLASRENEQSTESVKLQEGVFTYYIIQGEKYGYNNLTDLYNYIEKNVYQYTEKEQHPIYEGDLNGKTLFPK